MRKKIDKLAAGDNLNTSKDINDILSSALHKVEAYSVQLPERKFEQVFAEAAAHRQRIIDFFYKNDASVLNAVSLELKNILILSKNGLDEVKYKGKDVYDTVLKMVVSGIIGQ